MSVFDDEWLSMPSANLNGAVTPGTRNESLFYDGEVGPSASSPLLSAFFRSRTVNESMMQHGELAQNSMSSDDVRQHIINLLISGNTHELEHRYPEGTLSHNSAMRKWLLHAAAYYGAYTVIEWLVRSHNCDVEEQDEAGATMMHHAVFGDQKELMTLINLFYNGDLYARTANGATVLHLAARAGHEALVHWLVREHGMNIMNGDSRSATVLHYAGRGGHIGMITMLINNYSFIPGGIDSHGATIVHYAAMGGKQECIEWVIATQPLNITQLDRGGASVLHYAARGGRQELVQWLVENFFFDIRAVDNDKWSVLHYAALDGRYEFLAWVIKEYRFTADTRNTEGNTAREVAELAKHPACVEALEKLPAERTCTLM